MKKFRPIDFLSMAYGLAVMAIVIFTLNGLWHSLAIMGVTTLIIWMAIIQRGMPSKKDDEQANQ